MSLISAHVLDAAAGVPAGGMKVRLASAAGEEIAAAVTDSDGRVGDLGPEKLPPGHYSGHFRHGRLPHQPGTRHLLSTRHGEHHRGRGGSALPRTAAAQPVLLHHLPGQLTTTHDQDSHRLPPLLPRVDKEAHHE